MSFYGRPTDAWHALITQSILPDESVAATGKRVTEVDPLPAGLGNGEHYEVKINFEPDSEQ